jgi:hypothetical protein
MDRSNSLSVAVPRQSAGVARDLERLSAPCELNNKPTRHHLGWSRLMDHVCVTRSVPSKIDEFRSHFSTTGRA